MTCFVSTFYKDVWKLNYLLDMRNTCVNKITSHEISFNYGVFQMAFPGALIDPYLLLMMPRTFVTNHISHLEAFMQQHL